MGGDPPPGATQPTGAEGSIDGKIQVLLEHETIQPAQCLPPGGREKHKPQNWRSGAFDSAPPPTRRIVENNRGFGVEGAGRIVS